MKPKMFVLPGFMPVLIDAHATGDSAGLADPSGRNAPDSGSFLAHGIRPSARKRVTRSCEAPSNPIITTRGPSADVDDPDTPAASPATAESAALGAEAVAGGGVAADALAPGWAATLDCERQLLEKRAAAVVA